MSTSKVLMAGALAAFLALPLVASAQSTPSSPPPGITSGTVTGPNAHQGGGGLMGALRDMDLTPQQQSQIKAIVAQYRQAHPKGSAPDPQARKAMRQQVMGILTPDQQSTLKLRMQAQRGAHGGAGAGAQPPQNDAFPSDGSSPGSPPP